VSWIGKPTACEVETDRQKKKRGGLKATALFFAGYAARFRAAQGRPDSTLSARP